MSRMPAGQYIPGRSPVHRLDARIKICGFLILLAAVIGAGSWAGYLWVILALAAILRISGLPLRPVLEPFLRLWTFFLVIFLMNALFFDGQGGIWSWWIFHLSAEGVRRGFSVVVHVALALVLGNLLTCTTAPMELMEALKVFLRPLKLIRVPVDDVAMILSVAVQFVPTLLEEADTVKKAQIARGARFESKKLTEKAASFIPLVVPVFIAAFRRADELAQAMEARGYRGKRKIPKRKSACLQAPDITALAVCAAVFAVQFLLIHI